MSIELKVEDYCQNCPDFDAKVSTTQLVFGEAYNPTNTIITCSHKNRCAGIKRYLENLEAKKDGSIC